MGNRNSRPKSGARSQGAAYRYPSRLSQLEERIPTRRAGPDVICNICCNDGSERVIPISKVTSQCSRDRTICERCLQRHIQEVVVKQDYNNISCICTSSKCNSKLDYIHVQKYADPHTFRLYDSGLLRQALVKDPEFCWCSREGCGSGQLHSSRDQYPIMRCYECRSKTCFTHCCPWHEGRTCKEYDTDAKRSDEVALLQLLESSKYRRCPQCAHGVERNGGCDHMTCRCKHEFCWRCLAPYSGANGIWKQGNSAHKSSCRHFRK